MLEKLYFWKGGGGGMSTLIRILVIFLIVMLLLCAGGGAYWYYYIKLPADESLAQQQQAADALKADIASVRSWYEKALEGADIKSGMHILDELYRAQIPLRVLQLRFKGIEYSCTLKACQLALEFEPGAIVTQPEINFFGKGYQPSFPIGKGKNSTGKTTSLIYNNMAVKVENNALLSAYKKGKPLELYACDEVISYIKTYNSMLSSGKDKSATGEIVYKSLPASSITDKAKRLSGQVKSYDMLSADWTMELKGNENNKVTEIDAQMALYKQAYREAFLIRKIETLKNGFKVSGGLVCKA